MDLPPPSKRRKLDRALGLKTSFRTALPLLLAPFLLDDLARLVLDYFGCGFEDRLVRQVRYAQAMNASTVRVLAPGHLFAIGANRAFMECKAADNSWSKMAGGPTYDGSWITREGKGSYGDCCVPFGTGFFWLDPKGVANPEQGFDFYTVYAHRVCFKDLSTGQIQLWELPWQGEESHDPELAVSPDAKQMYVFRNNSWIYVWDRECKDPSQEVHTIRLFTDIRELGTWYHIHMEVSEDKLFVLRGSRSQMVVFDRKTHERLVEWYTCPGGSCKTYLRPRFCPDGTVSRRFAVLGDNVFLASLCGTEPQVCMFTWDGTWLQRVGAALPLWSGGPSHVFTDGDGVYVAEQDRVHHLV